MNTLTIILAISGVMMKIIQFFIALSILIIIHEFGHFMFAKLFKTRVNKFYLFFDFFFPFPNVMNFSIFKKKVGDTQYGMGWFPLGGYVQIDGMIDETTDKDKLAGPPKPWEYRSKKSWQKLLIMLGGIIMNMVLAYIIYIIIFAKYGESTLPVQNVKYGITTDSLTQSLGFQDGDRILKVGDQVPKSFGSIGAELVLSSAKTITIERNGEEKILPIPEGTIRTILKSRKRELFGFRLPFVVKEVQGNSLNKDILQSGDQILGIDGQNSPFIHDIQKSMLELKKTHEGAKEIPANVVILRQKDTVSTKINLNEKGLMGVALESPDKFLKFEDKHYTLGESFGKAFSFTIEKLGDYLQQLKLLFTSKEVKISESLGGFGSIGNLFPATFDMHAFLSLTAFISIILAFMNLLPIPGLDGGYVLFLIFEMITGIKVKDHVIEKANSIGLILLVALMMYANGLDIWRWFTGKF